MTPKFDNAHPLSRYTAASERASGQIIRSYSTSFGAATQLLGSRHRQHVRNVYGLVRVADELVDGVGTAAHLSTSEQTTHLDALERETEDAIATGYSSNPIVHAFAHTARTAGIDESLTRPFFASMRMDLTVPHTATVARTAMRTAIASFDAAAHATYVYGSAEVVGLMCLRIFTRDEPLTSANQRALEHGARSLGAAFQNVNFLRDLADDTERLERSYLSNGDTLTPELKAEWVATIRRQLADAKSVLPLLPADARVAVDCARRLFARLTDKLEHTPVDQLLTHRVRVSNAVKAALIAQSFAAQGGTQAS